MRVRLWLLAFLLTGWSLWLSRRLQALVAWVTRRMDRLAQHCEIEWLVCRAEAKFKRDRRH
jgi:hypothetical protein